MGKAGRSSRTVPPDPGGVARGFQSRFPGRTPRLCHGGGYTGGQDSSGLPWSGDTPQRGCREGGTSCSPGCRRLISIPKGDEGVGGGDDTSLFPPTFAVGWRAGREERRQQVAARGRSGLGLSKKKAIFRGKVRGGTSLPIICWKTRLQTSSPIRGGRGCRDHPLLSDLMGNFTVCRGGWVGVFFNIKTCSHRRLSLAPPLSTSLPTPLFPACPFLERRLFWESPLQR